MKLYYSAGSCSMSCHITLEESGLKYETVKIDFNNETNPNTLLVEKMNPMGTLPILITDDGKQLDQNLAIHVYIANLAKEKNLLPAFGTFERAETLNMLSFVATDLHKSIGALFSLGAYASDKLVQATVRANMMKGANQALNYLNSKLAGKDYIMGSTFTPVDSYAFTVVGWTKHLDISLGSFPNIEKYYSRIAARPAVLKVLKEEGLI